MCKSKLFKSLICGAVMALTIGTGVFAGTVEREEYVRNVATYTDSYSGTVGQYDVLGGTGGTKLTIRNTVGIPTLYYATVRAYNYASREYDNNVTTAHTLQPGGSASKSMQRDMYSERHRYDHIGEGFYSTTSSVRLDYYKYSAQHYAG